MPTTPNGLTYPDATGHTRLWEHLQALATGTDERLHRPRAVADLAALQAIPAADRRVGMLARITADGRVYEWTGTAWAYRYGGTAVTFAATIASGWTNLNALRGIVRDGWATLGGVVQNNAQYTGGQTAPAATLPAELRPSTLRFVAVPINSGTATVQFDINTDGRLIPARAGTVPISSWHGFDGVTYPLT